MCTMITSDVSMVLAPLSIRGCPQMNATLLNECNSLM